MRRPDAGQNGQVKPSNNICGFQKSATAESKSFGLQKSKLEFYRQVVETDLVAA